MNSASHVTKSNTVAVSTKSSPDQLKGRYEISRVANFVSNDLVLDFMVV